MREDREYSYSGVVRDGRGGRRDTIFECGDSETVVCETERDLYIQRVVECEPRKGRTEREMHARRGWGAET